MARRLRPATDSDQISWGDVAAIGGQSAITCSFWAYIVAQRSNDERYISKDSSFFPMQRQGSNTYYRVVHWVGGSLDFSSTNYPSSTTGVWQHYFVHWASGGKFSPYLDGVLGTESANRTGTIDNSTGALRVGRSDAEQANGYVAELAFWDVKLDLTEQATLQKGYSPLFVRPASLIFYTPLIGRNSAEPDLIGGATATLTGTEAVAHPRIIYPSLAQIRRFTTAVAGGGSSVKTVGGLALASVKTKNGLAAASIKSYGGLQ